MGGEADIVALCGDMNFIAHCPNAQRPNLVAQKQLEKLPGIAKSMLEPVPTAEPVDSTPVPSAEGAAEVAGAGRREELLLPPQGATKKRGSMFHAHVAMPRFSSKKKKKKKKKGKDKKGKKGKALLLDAAGNKRMSVILRSAMNKGVTVVERYYWDCNTVETTLMGCALVVCLAGIMF